MAFVHLHNHTQYSLLDGACRVDKMVQLAKEYGMPAVALTDHGNMFGAIDFFNTCKRTGIKPIIGLEAYIVNGDIEDDESKKNKRHHLVLLAKNLQGYKNLCKLTSYSYTKGFYYKPRIDKKLLQKYSEGLVCTSACFQGEIPALLLSGRKDEAKEVLQFYKDLFPDDFYLEIQDHGLEEEKAVSPLLMELARETDTPMIVTNDCHYLKKADADAHDVLLCIQTGKYFSDPDRMRFSSQELYFKTEEEMRKLFPQVPEAYDNTVAIADKIDLELDYNDFLLPRIDVPEKYDGDMGQYMRDLCYEAAEVKYPEVTDEVKERLDFELSVIHRMGYDGYFLVVKDFIDAARAQEIPVGPGRGSAAGSIVAYLLDITRLDPLKYGLLFERFLDLERVGMPDIDVDICSEGRGRVIDYVVEKYGRESVTQIVTFGTLGAKSVIKDVARVMEVAPSEANKITKLMPTGPKVTLKSALEESSEFAEYMNSNDLYKSILNYGTVLEGLMRQTGIHAAGVVIGPGDMSDYVPLAVNSQKGGESAVLVQYEGKWLDDLKLLKMDFLGLKTLTLIKKTVELVKQSQGIDVDTDNVPLDDKKAYELLSRGQTDGVFQFESAGMKKYLSELKPNVFEDLIAMVALYRPGPMQFIDTFIKRKHGVEEVQYDHPLTEETLKETYGVTVYQEQVMLISKRMAGFTSAEAGTLRKAIGKKKLDLMAKMEIKFKEGSQKNGVSKEIADKIWSDWLEFANYAFNKSHAACYGFISYQTAYLKANYPVEFMAALLSLEENPSKIPYFIDECKNIGIEVIPPNINKSEREFTVQGNKILFGLKAIKNVGSAAIKSLIEERSKDGDYKNIYEFATRVDPMGVNKTVLESLISSGAMDELDGNRAQKYAAIEQALEYAANVLIEKKRGQMMLFDAFQDEDDDEDLSMPQLPDLHEWGLNHKLKQEKEYLGFYWSGHPLNQYKSMLSLIANVDTKYAELYPEKIPANVAIAGVVADVVKKITKRGDPFAIVTLEDFAGKFEISLFSENFGLFFHLMQEGKMLFIIGKKNTSPYGNENILRVIPKQILPFENLPKNLSGDIYMKMREEEATPEFAEEIKSKFDQNPGKFSLHITVETEKFKTLNLHSRNLKIFPEEELMKNIMSRLKDKPRLNLNFKGGF